MARWLYSMVALNLEAETEIKGFLNPKRLGQASLDFDEELVKRLERTMTNWLQIRSRVVLFHHVFVDGWEAPHLVAYEGLKKVGAVPRCLDRLSTHGVVFIESGDDVDLRRDVLQPLERRNVMMYRSVVGKWGADMFASVLSRLEELRLAWRVGGLITCRCLGPSMDDVEQLQERGRL